jgi:hypothetical protein
LIKEFRSQESEYRSQNTGVRSQKSEVELFCLLSPFPLNHFAKPDYNNSIMKKCTMHTTRKEKGQEEPTLLKGYLPVRTLSIKKKGGDYAR